MATDGSSAESGLPGRHVCIENSLAALVLSGCRRDKWLFLLPPTALFRSFTFVFVNPTVAGVFAMQSSSVQRAAFGIRGGSLQSLYQTLTYRQWSESHINFTTLTTSAAKLGLNRPNAVLLHDVPRSALPSDVLRALRDARAVDGDFPLSRSESSPCSSTHSEPDPVVTIYSHSTTDLYPSSCNSHHELPYPVRQSLRYRGILSPAVHPTTFFQCLDTACAKCLLYKLLNEQSTQLS